MMLRFWVVGGTVILELIGQIGIANAIGFAGAFDPSNWTFSTNAGNGTVNNSDAPLSITLVSDDTNDFASLIPGDYAEYILRPIRNYADYTIVIPEGVQNISFAWSYRTSDRNGPSLDPFGYLVNGNYTALSINDGSNNLSTITGPIGRNEYLELSRPVGSYNQSGVKSVNVSPGSIFGFRAGSLDGLYGPSVTKISNFIDSPTPQPVSLEL